MSTSAQKDEPCLAIVGRSIAGLTLARHLREGGYDSSILSFESEKCEPYDRPPLSKELFGNYFHPLAEEGYGSLEDIGARQIDETVTHIESITSTFTSAFTRTEAENSSLTTKIETSAYHSYTAEDAAYTSGILDASTRTNPRWRLTTAEGHTFEIHTLVLATGTRPHATIPGARVLYSASDAETLRSQIGKGSCVHIVGAGWIGMELASQCANVGAHVEVWEASPHILGRSFAGAVTDIWQPFLRKAGVKLHLATPYPGGLNCDVLVQATGASPTFPLPSHLGIRSARGAVAVDVWGRILADATPLTHSSPICQAIFPGLYAIGDCADTLLPTGTWNEGGHWMSALHGAARTATHLLGTESSLRFLEAPEIFSTQFGHEIGFVGTVEPHARIEREETEDSLILRWFTGHTLRGLLAVDAPRALARARKVLRSPLPNQEV